MEENKEKRVLRLELDDDVKRVSITAKNANGQVVMKQELSDDDLDQATGGDRGGRAGRHCFVHCPPNY